MWWLLWGISVRHVGFAKVYVCVCVCVCVCVKSSCLSAIRNINSWWGSVSVYNIWKSCQTYQILCIWRKEQIDKEHQRIWCKFVVSLLLRLCNVLWYRHAHCDWETIWSTVYCNIFVRRFEKEGFWAYTGWYWGTQRVY